MASSYPSQLNPGLFIPTTNSWDVDQLYTVDINSDQFRELLVRLYQNVNNIALAVNLKDTGYYTLQEFLNSQAFFPDPTLSSQTPANPVFRQVFRKVIDFGTLPNAGTKSIPHGIQITDRYSFTRIYATASDPVGFNYIPLPYASPTDVNEIELNVDLTNVNIITGSNRSNFTTCFVVLEYIKQ